jgi:hypothetical protein
MNNDWVDAVLEKALIDGKVDYFHETYSFEEEPSKDVLIHDSIVRAKEHLDMVWNQFLAYEENMSEAVFNESYHMVLDDMSPWNIIEMFSAYFGGYMEGATEEQED